MFTGIVSEIGTVREAGRRAGGLEISIDCAYQDLQPGESVAVDGACLTVEVAGPTRFSVHVVPTTLDRTRFTEYSPGRRVNLERALRVGDRLGGHMVQAHIDGLGTVEEVTESGDTRLLNIRIPAEVARISVPLGSITIDGVSLTVNAKPHADLIQISLIPFTLQQTTLGERRVGDRVHVEGDAIAKYVAALLEQSKQ